ncbi:MAG: hypothetical protein Q9M40_04625 [Sulfurimonas sp.]|nr:hypothetical protein [Sulfurimonas sp.]
MEKLRKHKRPISNNYVSAFAFCDDLFACSGYGGSITVLKIHSLSSRYTISSSALRIDALCFYDKDTLLSASVDGSLHIYSLKQKNT